MTFKLNKRKAQILDEAITHWEQEKLVSMEQSENLRQSYQVANFDWKLLAVYSFWVAIACFILSVILLVADDYLMSLLAKLINTPASVLTVITAFLSAGFYYLGVRRRAKFPEKSISNEAIFFFGVLLTAVSVGFLSKTTFAEHWRESLFIAIPAIIYCGLGIKLRSVLIWLFFLLSAGLYLLSETSYLSDSHYLFLGMNIPLQFTCFGAIIILISLLFPKIKIVKSLTEATRFAGLFYFFTSLWLLTIFGNYDSFHEWSQIKQVELWTWSLLALACCTIAIVIGIRTNDVMTRTFGITFMLIVLYTEYFTYFWGEIHKALFFAVLALSFWFIGTRAEKLWQPNK
ncbi:MULTISPECIES: hypothetical protein [unclassified Photobacterium]|uniref:hypothetical protein n=1 Tax=unclassified Photobacterium TaxID=2628852 RepID=UPI001EDEAC6B|nr:MULTISPECIES: hypothetical protein [unclassified Photobacterium]MCG3863495.1 hypothetical protein [Photobacterium sp. Ph6]MCG3875024.1 hypothetical protein [Photobacterium sp. Ph5]